MFKRLLVLGLVLLVSASCSFAAKIPESVKSIVLTDFPSTDFRFDGVIILPDNTVYLPVFPSRLLKSQDVCVAQTVPDSLKLKDKPDIVVFSNNFVLLKMIVNEKGEKTVLRQDTPFQQIKTGLLPQDMLVPKGLIIPANIKSIIGNLKIMAVDEPDIKIEANPNEFSAIVTKEEDVDVVSGDVSQLKNKTVYVRTCYSKNIHVLKGENSKSDYALSIKGLPVDFELVNDDKFMLVTTYNRTFLDVISIADNRIIKQIDLKSQPAEIVIDEKNLKAYISCPTDSSICVVSLTDMLLKQKIKVNGTCEKLALFDNKLFYTDKKDNEIWAVELDNNFLLKDVGTFPNVSSLIYKNGTVYMISRTGNRLAISDYDNGILIKEIDTVKKPVGLLLFGKELFVLGAGENELQVLNTENNEVVSVDKISSNGFLNSIYRVKGTGLAIVSDIRNCKYFVLNLNTKKIIKTNKINIPVSDILVGESIKEISK